MLAYSCSALKEPKIHIHASLARVVGLIGLLLFYTIVSRMGQGHRILGVALGRLTYRPELDVQAPCCCLFGYHRRPREHK